MKMHVRIQRLEARVPKAPERFILVWIGPNSQTTKAADTHPDLPDNREYTRNLAPYSPEEES